MVSPGKASVVRINLNVWSHAAQPSMVGAGDAVGAGVGSGIKQISTEYRLKLAEAILLVNEWVETGGSPKLIATAQEKMEGFSVTFNEDAKPEAAAALALLLFADPDIQMPGGFTSAELSETSPIKAISSFPQELVLLGRATILIKGIAKRHAPRARRR